MHERIDTAGAVAGYAALVAAGAKDLTPADLLPKWGEERKQSADEMVALMRGFMQPKGV